jgi:hypothetical protein
MMEIHANAKTAKYFKDNPEIAKAVVEGVEKMLNEGKEMSRNKQLITRAVEQHGYKVVSINYERLQGNFEMVGSVGGWSVEVDPYEHIVGNSVKDVLESIERWLQKGEQT